jgi:cytochrome c5
MTSCDLVRLAACALRSARVFALTSALVLCAGVACSPDSGRDAFPGANHVPYSQPDSERFQAQPDPRAPKDEAQAGVTRRGTPVQARDECAFPAEARNLFFEVDQVASGPGGMLAPFDYTDGKRVTPEGRSAIQGQNTWMLWSGGNEAFLDWLHAHNYGLVDFLVLLDSRKRDRRFKDVGLINQPGMTAQKDPARRILGLYLDVADGDRVLLQPPKSQSDPEPRSKPNCTAPAPARDQKAVEPPAGENDRKLYEEALRSLDRLPRDGADPDVYGFPSGVVGLRLMPNPDFFAPSAVPARREWERRVVAPGIDAFYADPAINADPKLVRPFRVGMTCVFCHAAPHPLRPPTNPEAPEWRNLSSTIGNQYWRPERILTNLVKDDNFIHHVVAAQLPGTVDTSLVSTDHINNANAINAMFDVPARLQRAMLNPAESQSPANLLSPSVEEHGASVDPRHVPRILLDGADSIGVFASFSRVYLNIGTYSEEWVRLHNPIIGFVPQRPFSVATAKANSVYWRATEQRVASLLAFFTYRGATTKRFITQPMQLAHTPQGRAKLDAERDAAASGRDVFLRNCAVCHSSKQPPGFKLEFSAEWAKARSAGASLTLPTDFGDWERFRKSPAYEEYVRLVLHEAGKGGPEEFFADNYLSTDVRVPVTLVGTNSARSMGTNGMRGQVWDNFSSETYKNLPSVGAVRFYNPYSGAPVDAWGNNDAYVAPAGGPGYYRPPSLIGIWATAPFLHTNALGSYDKDNPDPSVEGRLAAFDDAIEKLFWRDKRSDDEDRKKSAGFARQHFAERDPGLIYRTPIDTWIGFPAKVVRSLLEGVLGSTALAVAWWAGIVLVVILAVLAIRGVRREAGLVLLVVAFVLAIGLLLTRLDKVYGLLWGLPAVALAGAFGFWIGRGRGRSARVVLGALCVATLAGVIAARAFIDGRLGDLRLGPIPRGTPVNLIMNLNPQAPPGVVLEAFTGLLRGILRAGAGGLQDAGKLKAFEQEAAGPLMRASKCPDLVLDRGHWFADGLSDADKLSLKAFLKTL